MPLIPENIFDDLMQPVWNQSLKVLEGKLPSSFVVNVIIVICHFHFQLVISAHNNNKYIYLLYIVPDFDIIKTQMTFWHFDILTSCSTHPKIFFEKSWSFIRKPQSQCCIFAPDLKVKGPADCRQTVVRGLENEGRCKRADVR